VAGSNFPAAVFFVFILCRRHGIFSTASEKMGRKKPMLHKL